MAVASGLSPRVGAGACSSFRQSSAFSSSHRPPVPATFASCPCSGPATFASNAYPRFATSSSISLLLPAASYSYGRSPGSSTAGSKGQRTSPTVSVHQSLSPLSPSSDSLVVAQDTNHYIREDYLVKKVSSSEVRELLKGDRSVPLIIDFYATWCGPCILMAQDLEMLAVEYESNALFIKVDTDDEYEFARDMQVRGLPTLYFISPDPSKDAIRTEGLVPPEMIKNIIDNEM